MGKFMTDGTEGIKYASLQSQGRLDLSIWLFKKIEVSKLTHEVDGMECYHVATIVSYIRKSLKHDPLVT